MIHILEPLITHWREGEREKRGKGEGKGGKKGKEGKEVERERKGTKKRKGEGIGREKGREGVGKTLYLCLKLSTKIGTYFISLLDGFCLDSIHV